MSGGAPITRPMVLIVDPRDDTRDLHGDWFVSVGFDVVCVTEARTAFQIAKAVHPDLILTELRLRDSDGLQLVRQLQATAVTRHIPVLVVTSSTQAGVLEQATAAGATAAISALGSLDVLSTHVTAIMARAGSVAQPTRRRRHTPLSAILLASDDGNASKES